MSLQYMNAQIHQDHQNFSFECDTDNTDGEQINLNLFFMVEEQYNNQCQFKSVKIAGNCIENVLINSIDIQNTDQQLVYEKSIFNNKIYIKGENVKKMEIYNLQIQNIQLFSQQQDANNVLFNIINVQQELILKDLTFRNLTDINQDIISIQLCNNVKFRSIHILDNINSENEQIISLQQLTNLTIQNSLIQNNGGYHRYSIFKFSDLSNVKIEYSIFQDNKIIIIQNNNVQGLFINDCHVQNNSAFKGTFLDGSYINNIVIQNSDLIENKASYNGGLFYLDQVQGFLLDNVLLERNQADQAGILYILSSTHIKFFNITARDNSAIKEGGIIKGDKLQYFEIIDCYLERFKSIKTVGGFGMLNYVDHFLIQNGTFIKGHGPLGQGMFRLRGSENFTITDSYFHANKAETGFGACFQLSLMGEIFMIKNTVISDNYASKSGAISLRSNDYTYRFKNVTFINNHCDQIGGVIDSMRIDMEFIDCKFENNYSFEGGGALNLLQPKQLKIQNCIFINNTSVLGGSLNIISAQKTLIQNSIFKDSKAEQGGGIYLTSNDQITLQNITVENNTANINGGGIYMDQGQVMVLIDSKIIKNTVQSSISQGGGIYALEIENITIQETSFLNNQAIDKGGGIYLNKVQNLILNQVQFDKNYVEFDINIDIEKKVRGYHLSKGGAIFYFCSEIIKYIEDEDVPQISTLSMQKVQFSNNKASSGSSLLIYQELQALFKIKKFDEISIQNDSVDVGLIRYLGNQYNEHQQILDQFEQKNNHLMVHKDTKTIVKYIQNEQMMQNSFEFNLCSLGTSLKDGGERICKKCIDNGICKGGYVGTFPKEGYWRENKTTWDFIHCDKKPENCIGQDLCKKGYKGVLCEECDYVGGYNQSAIKTCSFCPSNFVISCILSLIFISYVMIIFVTSRKLRQKVQENLLKKYLLKMWGKIVNYDNQSSPITKIIIMHLQITYMVIPKDIQILDFYISFTSGIYNYKEINNIMLEQFEQQRFKFPQIYSKQVQEYYKSKYYDNMTQDSIVRLKQQSNNSYQSKDVSYFKKYYMDDKNNINGQSLQDSYISLDQINSQNKINNQQSVIVDTQLYQSNSPMIREEQLLSENSQQLKNPNNNSNINQSINQLDKQNQLEQQLQSIQFTQDSSIDLAVTERIDQMSNNYSNSNSNNNNDEDGDKQQGLKLNQSGNTTNKNSLKKIQTAETSSSFKSRKQINPTAKSIIRSTRKHTNLKQFK